MFEELRENVLTLLEERVESAINTIHRLRQDNLALESEIGQLRDDVRQRDVQIQELERRNAELKHVESNLEALQGKYEQERQEGNREKAGIRERLEGLMALLNSVDSNGEAHELEQPTAPEEQPTAPEEASEAVALTEIALPDSSPLSDDSTAEDTQ